MTIKGLRKVEPTIKPDDAQVCHEHLGRLSDLICAFRVKRDRGDVGAAMDLEALAADLCDLVDDFTDLPMVDELPLEEADNDV